MDCSVDGCEHDARKGGLCWGHTKRKVRGQVVNDALAPKHKSPMDRVTEAAIVYADAEDDEAFRLARDNLRKAVDARHEEAINEALARVAHEAREAVRRALSDARDRGLVLGRPPRIHPDEIAAVVAAFTSVRKAAVALKMARSTIQRALRRAEHGGPRIPG